MTTLNHAGQPRANPPDLSEVLQSSGDNFIHAAYWALLGREVDVDGLRFYKERLLEGVSKIQILGELALSAEAIAHGGAVPGLSAALRRQRLLTMPILGRVISLFRPAGHRSAVGTQLQSLEARTEYGLQELQHRLDSVSQTLAALRSEIHHLAAASGDGKTDRTVANGHVTSTSLKIPCLRYDTGHSKLAEASPLEAASIRERR